MLTFFIVLVKSKERECQREILSMRMSNKLICKFGISCCSIIGEAGRHTPYGSIVYEFKKIVFDRSDTDQTSKE